MPPSAYGLLILGLFVIAWIAIAWRFHLPADGKGRGAYNRIWITNQL